MGPYKYGMPKTTDPGLRTALLRCPYEIDISRAHTGRFRFFEKLERHGLVIGKTSPAGMTTFSLTDAGRDALAGTVRE